MSHQSINAPIPVPRHVLGLLCEIAYGWKPVPLPMSKVEHLSYGDVDLSSHEATVYIENNELTVAINSFSRDGHRDIPMSLIHHGKLCGRLQCGTNFSGELVRSFSRGAHASKENGVFDAIVIKTSIWYIGDSEAPSLWIGRIDGTFDSLFSGNLIIERREPTWPLAGERCHFFLSGSYDYYLIRHGRNPAAVWALVIDTRGSGRPDIDLLGRDFLAIQFVLGRQLRVPELLGLTLDHRTVAYMRGCDTRKNLEENSYPPVPYGRTNNGFVEVSWPTLFFERISTVWRSRPEWYSVYWMALEAYLESMSNHLDSDYMRLQIALESFAYWIQAQRNQNQGGEGESLDFRMVTSPAAV